MKSVKWFRAEYNKKFKDKIFILDFLGLSIYAPSLIRLNERLVPLTLLTLANFLSQLSW